MAQDPMLHEKGEGHKTSLRCFIWGGAQDLSEMFHTSTEEGVCNIFSMQASHTVVGEFSDLHLSEGYSTLK